MYHVTNYKKKKKLSNLNSPITFINTSIRMLYVKKKKKIDSTFGIL